MFTMHLFVLFLSLYKSIITFDRYFVSFFFFKKKTSYTIYKKLDTTNCISFLFQTCCLILWTMSKYQINKILFQHVFFFFNVRVKLPVITVALFLPSLEPLELASLLHAIRAVEHNREPSSSIQDCSHPFSCLLVIVVFVILTSLW